MSTAAVAMEGDDGTALYFASGEPRLYRVEGEGVVDWSVKLAATVTGTPAFDPAAGVVYVGAENGRLYAFDDAGAEAWSHDAGAPIRSPVILVSAGGGIRYR